MDLCKPNKYPVNFLKKVESSPPRGESPPHEGSLIKRSLQGIRGRGITQWLEGPLDPLNWLNLLNPKSSKIPRV